MRALVLLGVVACGSPSPVARPPSPPPAPGAPAPSDAQLPKADPLIVGKELRRDIGAKQVHRYRVTAAANMVISGVVEQDGVDLEVVTYDASGAKIHTFDSPNGDHGPEPFTIETKAAGSYDFEVRLVELPPGVVIPDMASHGAYRAKVSDVITADDYAIKVAEDHIASARILGLWRDVRRHHTAAVDKFWVDLQGKGPIVEPYPGVPEDSLVTFVMRTKRAYVGAVGVMGFEERPFVRVGDSDVWFLTARMPADSRFDYGYIVDDGPPEYTTKRDQKLPGRFANIQRDPTNPVGHELFSRTELPGAQPQPYIVANKDTPKGEVRTISIDSKRLKEKRGVGVYLPPGYDPKARYPLLVVFDGESYGLRPQSEIPTPTILDNMIAAKKIPPIVAALVPNQGIRRRDLAYYEPFGQFIAEEVVGKLRADFHAGTKPEDVIVCGSSLGGLTSLYVAFHHSDVIGKVLSQSGSYQFIPGAFDKDLAPYAEGNSLAREIAAAPKKPLKVYLETGTFEASLRDSNRHMRDTLVAKGYPVTFREFHGGHDYWVWRGTISDGLMALLPAR